MLQTTAKEIQFYALEVKQSLRTNVDLIDYDVRVRLSCNRVAISPPPPPLFRAVSLPRV